MQIKTTSEYNFYLSNWQKSPKLGRPERGRRPGAESHSDTWLFSERRPRATFPPLSGARVDRRGAWLGVAAGRRRGVEGHAASVSWRPPGWVQPASRCGLAYLACATAGRPGTCGRARVGPLGPRVPGGAWLHRARGAPRALTAIVWNCYGERARPGPGERSGSSPKGLGRVRPHSRAGGGGRADLLLFCDSQPVLAGCLWVRVCGG